jgi:hypothetical protein
LARVFSLLDICCGFGFWSIPFYREGFECTGVDIVDVGYPYELILEDIRDFHPNRQYDVVMESPPCTEFSELLFLAVAKKQRPLGNPEKGMELVREAYRIVQEAKPRYWALENVRGSVLYISKLLGPPRIKHHPWYIWGKFPEFMLDRSELGLKVRSGPNGRLNPDVKFDPLIAWKRSRIPLPLGTAMARACRMALEKE